MIIEVTKKQLMDALEDFIYEEISTEEYEKFILKHIKNYGKYQNADMYKIKEISNKLYKKTGFDSEEL